MHSIGRRQVLAGAGAAVLLGGLDGCIALGDRRAASPALQLAPIRAGTDRITRITVCTRPFRPRGLGSIRNVWAQNSSFTITVTAAAAGRYRGVRAA